MFFLPTQGDQEEEIRSILEWAKEELPTLLVPPLDLPTAISTISQNQNLDFINNLEFDNFTKLLFKAVEEFVSQQQQQQQPHQQQPTSTITEQQQQQRVSIVEVEVKISNDVFLSSVVSVV
jgi:hypothetical protein